MMLNRFCRRTIFEYHAGKKRRQKRVGVKIEMELAALLLLCKENILMVAIITKFSPEAATVLKTLAL